MRSIERHVENNLSERRRLHISGVVRTAGKLAQKFGINVEQAETAAFFHDMYRGTAIEVLNMYVRQLNLSDQFIDNANLSHGKVAAFIMERDFDITDEDVINAVKYHTTGREGMSRLEQIIYLADAIEPSRDYPEIEHLRKLAEISLEEACLATIERSITYLEEKGEAIHIDTIKARDFLRIEREK